MKILIAYATKSGTTRICAEKLAELLPQHRVTVADLSETSGLRPSDFDFTVIGAPIRTGKLHKAAKKFIENNTFEHGKYALFICNALNEKTAEYFRKNFSPELLQSALAYTSLGGELKPDRQSGLDKFFLKMLLESKRDDDEFTMPTLFTEEIGRLADKIKSAL